MIGGDPALKVVSDNEMPNPDRADLISSTVTYFVGPFDRLVINVFGMEELSQVEVQVDGSGRMSFPLAGVINVNGMTPAEIEASLTTRLTAAHLRDPQVTVNLKEALSRVFTVEGQVKKPGVYPMLGELTLIGAIAKAEGTDEYARLDDVVVFRTVRGQRYATLYNLDAIRHGAYADPEIFPSDVVMVGESRGRRLFKDILATTPALVTPIVIGLDRLTN